MKKHHIHILVAMEREGEALGLPFDVVGIGATTLPPIQPEDIIINVGYCGGDSVPVGTVVEPAAVVDAEDGLLHPLTSHFSGVEKCVCVTSPTFVTAPITASPAVYDMELAKLARIPCAGLFVLKIVSDNLNESDCERFSDSSAWQRVRELILPLLW